MTAQTSGPPNTSRRNALKFMATGLATLASSPAFAMQHAESPGKPDTAAQALDRLMQGNARYVTQKLTACSADFPHLREHTEAHQDPFAAILACADSRVPTELVFDQTLGDLFVVRVAGNVATSDTIASLEYAGAMLAIKTIIVVGHTACGAVKAASAGGPAPGQITTLYQYIRPALANNKDLTEGSRRNARLQAATLRDASPVLSALVAEKKLVIKAAIYDVGSGKVTLLDD